MDANARLIAAAPDMLEALRQVVLGFCEDTPLTKLQREGLMEEVRAAIAKAEGRS